MKYIKEINIEKKQFFLIEDSNIEINNLNIKDINFYDDFYLEKIDFFINRKMANICFDIIKFFDKEKIKPYIKKLIKIVKNSDDPVVYSKISNMASRYARITGRRIPLKSEDMFFNNLDSIATGLNSVYILSEYYEYVMIFKKRFERFETVLLNLNNMRGGLKLTGIPYDSRDDLTNDEHLEIILDEFIYNYTVNNYGGIWPEIGINTKNDLMKLRNQLSGYSMLELSHFFLNDPQYSEFSY